jgi:hypothetical protein
MDNYEKQVQMATMSGLTRLRLVQIVAGMDTMTCLHSRNIWRSQSV